MKGKVGREWFKSSRSPWASSGTWPPFTSLFLRKAVFYTRYFLPNFRDAVPTELVALSITNCASSRAQNVAFLDNLLPYLVPSLVSVGWFLLCRLNFWSLTMGASTQHLSGFPACHALPCFNFHLACQYPWKQTSYPFGSHCQALSWLQRLLGEPLQRAISAFGDTARVFSYREMD